MEDTTKPRSRTGATSAPPGPTKLLRVLHWARGEHALAHVEAAGGDLTRPLTALEGMESLAGLLATTSEAHAASVQRLAPETKGAVPLLAAAKSLRFYLPIPPRATFEVEATVVPEGGELVVVQTEARLTSGERAAKGELRFLLVPGAGEHARAATTLAQLREGLGSFDW